MYQSILLYHSNLDQTMSSNVEVLTATLSRPSLGCNARVNLSAGEQQVTSTPTNQLDQSEAITAKTISLASSHDGHRESSTPTVSGDQTSTIAVPSTHNPSKLESNQVLSQTTNSNGSQKQHQQMPAASSSAKIPASLADGRNTSDEPKTSDNATHLLGDGLDNAGYKDEEEEDDEVEEDKDCGADLNDNKNRSFKPSKDRAPTPVRSRNSLNSSATATTTKSSNFVRNSLPSRSVNFGHSKPSAFLDRIRASVTATTTTNTSTSFNGQTRNIVLSNQEQLQQANLQQTQPLKQRVQDSRYELNCMLDHQHSDRCFVLQNAGRAQHSQVVASDQHNHHHNVASLQSSRQLDALIDPVSDEQLMMNMLQHQGHQRLIHNLRNQQQHSRVQHVNPELDGVELTEQQIAHLASLHQRHYYHHLQQMRQLHHLHHQHYLHLHNHRMHHKYQQQQRPTVQQQTSGGSVQPACTGKLSQNSKHDESKLLFNQHDTQKQPTKLSVQQFEPVYSGGSQFYAPSAHFNQLYENMNNNNNIKHTGEHDHRTRLVSNGNGNSGSSSCSNLPESPLRSSPSRLHPTRLSPQRLAHQLNHAYNLPQIDEVNGLPTVESLNTSLGFQAKGQQHQCRAQAVPSEAKAHNNLSSNVSPSSSSSSPTSSTSSNLSPSSASSSSSLNSLSTTPLNRSALRHTTTDLSRRQFSVERDLAGSLPMKATLSRVGSCRINRTIDDTTLCQSQNSVQMRTPVKSQQPSMRTSKILNISQQSNAQTASLHPQQQQQCLFTSPNHAATYAANGSRMSYNKEQLVTNGKLADNLAKVNLNDNNLAFTSLQMPPKTNSSGRDNVLSNDSSSTLNCSTSSSLQQTQVVSPNSSSSGKILASVPGSVSKERLKQGKTSNSTKKTTATKGTNGSKSSIWFEYGCV